MSKPKLKKGPKTLEDKIRDFDGSFVEEVYAANNDQLKDRLVALASYDELLDKQEKEDEDLKQKREVAKEAAKTYSEPRAANKLKRKLVVQILGDRGKV
jgi:hypothetical protein